MICVDCKKFFRPKRNGIYVEEMMPSPTVEGALAHVVVNDEFWVPYKLWSADLWECPGCKKQVIGGLPGQPIAEHYQTVYGSMREHAVASGKDFYQVPDCGPTRSGWQPGQHIKVEDANVEG